VLLTHNRPSVIAAVTADSGTSSAARRLVSTGSLGVAAEARCLLCARWPAALCARGGFTRAASSYLGGRGADLDSLTVAALSPRGVV
jgi:hypothetical protein